MPKIESWSSRMKYTLHIVYRPDSMILIIQLLETCWPTEKTWHVDVGLDGFHDTQQVRYHLEISLFLWCMCFDIDLDCMKVRRCHCSLYVGAEKFFNVVTKKLSWAWSRTLFCSCSRRHGLQTVSLGRHDSVPITSIAGNSLRVLIWVSKKYSCHVVTPLKPAVTSTCNEVSSTNTKKHWRKYILDCEGKGVDSNSVEIKSNGWRLSRSCSFRLLTEFGKKQLTFYWPDCSGVICWSLSARGQCVWLMSRAHTVVMTSRRKENLCYSLGVIVRLAFAVRNAVDLNVVIVNAEVTRRCITYDVNVKLRSNCHTV